MDSAKQTKQINQQANLRIRSVTLQVLKRTRIPLILFLTFLMAGILRAVFQSHAGEQENLQKQNHGCHSHRCLKFPDFSLTNVKFP